MIFNALTRVTIKSLKKKVYYFFKKNVIVTRGNALENGQLYTYFTENVLGDIQ